MFLNQLTDGSYGSAHDAADSFLYTWRESVERADACGLDPIDIPETLAELIPNFPSELVVTDLPLICPVV